MSKEPPKTIEEIFERKKQTRDAARARLLFEKMAIAIETYKEREAFFRRSAKPRTDRSAFD